MSDTPQLETLASAIDVEAHVDVDTITVLHVDDEPDFAEMATTFLERMSDDIETIVETSADDALARLRDGDTVDCVVSDYQMPNKDGIEFLQEVRADYPNLPFILFTGKGSEEVASDAVSAGVTDYMQKRSRTDQYKILANRIENVVEGYRFQIDSAERGRRLDTLINNLPGLVYRCRAEKGWPMESVEGECESLTGYTSAEIECGEISFGDDVIHPADRDLVWQTVQDALVESDPFELTYRIVTKDDTEKWVWERGRGLNPANGEPRVLEGFITDISERKEGTVSELNRDPDPLQTLFDNTTDCVAYCEFECDSPVIIDVNSAFETTFGFEAGDLIGESLEETIFPSESLEKGRRISQRVKDGERVEAELQCQTANGIRTFSHRAVPIRTDGGVTETYAIFTDVTEQKEDKQQIQRLEHFAERLSHDLRNPLSVAQGNLELLNETGEVKHYETANRALARMENLISDILTLAQTGEQISLSEYDSVELATVADNAWALLRTGDATLSIEETTTIDADASRLQQIFENLFRNANEHGPDDVTVRVGLLPEEQGFYVADDGPGIPPEQRNEVFEAEYSTKHDGTGFGLATISQIVDAHDWEIRITESGDDGTRFELYNIEGLSTDHETH